MDVDLKLLPVWTEKGRAVSRAVLPLARHAELFQAIENASQFVPEDFALDCYLAVDQNGKHHEGQLRADDPDGVLSLLNAGRLARLPERIPRRFSEPPLSGERRGGGLPRGSAGRAPDRPLLELTMCARYTSRRR